MLRIALLVAVVVGVASPAAACPPGPCNKYRRPVHPEVLAPKATAYVRQTGARLPRFTRAGISAFLTSSLWEPIVPLVGVHDREVEIVMPPWLHFVEARGLVRKHRTARTTLLRRIEVRRGTAMIEIDGDVFVLGRCEDMPRRVCLNRRSDLSFAEPVVDTTFAQPPES